MLRLKICRTPAEIESLRPVWNYLFEKDRGTLFQSFAWNHLAAQLLTPAPWVVWAESDAGMALVPACHSLANPTQLEFLGDELFDYRDALAIGNESALMHAVAAFGEEKAILAAPAIVAQAHSRWQPLGAKLTPFSNAPRVLCSEVTAEAFTARHTRSARLLRRLSRQGVEMRQRAGGSSLLVRAIYRAKAEQFDGSANNIFADPRRVDFMVQIAATDPGCEIFTLEGASRLIAALVIFRDGETRRFYTVYYHPAWAQHSPGQALLYEVTRISLAQGLNCDYMTGEQPHKLRLATSAMPLLSMEVSTRPIAAALDVNHLAA